MVIEYLGYSLRRNSGGIFIDDGLAEWAFPTWTEAIEWIENRGNARPDLKWEDPPNENHRDTVSR